MGMRIKYEELIMTRTQRAFYITALILMLQVTRNINAIIYVAFLFISYGWLYISLILDTKTGIELPSNMFKISKLLFIITILWVPIISLGNSDSTEFINSIARYLVTLPYLIALYIYKGFNDIFIKKFIRLFVYFIAISALSIPFQMVVGPLPFLEEPYMRAGVMRYASIAGSLNALGTLAGFAIVLIIMSEDEYFKSKERIILFLVIVLGALLSMQKAAVLNIIISIGLYLMSKREKKFGKGLFVFSIISILFLFYPLMEKFNIVNIISNIVSYTVVGNNELNLWTDLVSRIWDLPSNVVKYHNMDMADWIMGIGFPALSGILGNPELPMAHNNYFDLIFSGGILHLISFVYLLIRIWILTFKRNINNKNKNYREVSYASVILLIIANMFNGTATMYQPVNAVIIYFVIFTFDYTGYADKRYM